MKIMHLNGDVVLTDASTTVDPPSLIHQSLEAIDPQRYHRDFSVVEFAAHGSAEYYVVFFPRLRVRCIDHMVFSATQSIYQFTVEKDTDAILGETAETVTMIFSVRTHGEKTEDAEIQSVYYAGQELDMKQPVPLDRLVAYLMVALFPLTKGRIQAADYAEMVRILRRRLSGY